MRKKYNYFNRPNYLAVVVMGGLAILCFVPFMMVISGSLSDSLSLSKYGYTVIPKTIDFSAYKSVLNEPSQLIKAYMTTIFVTVVGASTGLLLTAMCAYSLSRRDFKYRNQLSFFCYFTMLFSGGLVPTYLLVAQFFKMKDTVWVLIVPSLIQVGRIFYLKMFFQSLPSSLIESAKIDGASEFHICFRIAFPLTKGALALIALYLVLAKWNEWYACMLYIDRGDIVTLQYLLMRVQNSINFLRERASASGGLLESAINVPSESVQMATVILVAGPTLVIFPFFQKYFVKGSTQGAVKE